jgi:hypothetical protein
LPNRIHYLKSVGLGLLIFFCCSCSSTKPAKEKVDHSKHYFFTTDTDESGKGLYCRVQRFTHSESNKSVTLIGMIHMADSSFYDKVLNLSQKHDTSLTEGVHGNPTLSAHHYLLKYIVGSYGRISYYNNLAAQSYYMNEPKNALNADISIEAFADESSFLQSCVQTLALPILVVAGESSNALLWLHHQLSLSAVSDDFKNSSSLAFREEIFVSSTSDHEVSEEIPGIITARNKNLMQILDTQLTKAEIHSVAIPWGAAHMPDLEERLIQRGFKRDSKEILWNAVSLEKKTIAQESQKIDFFYIPYLTFHYRDPYSSQSNYLASLISSQSIHDQYHFNLGWDLITTYTSTKRGAAFSLLPRLFGKPLLFDYRRTNKKQRWRFLYFFNIESEIE